MDGSCCFLLLFLLLSSAGLEIARVTMTQQILLYFRSKSRIYQKPDIAMQRYGKDYKTLLRQINDALNAPPPVNTPKLRFKGFPSNMGEQVHLANFCCLQSCLLMSHIFL